MERVFMPAMLLRGPGLALCLVSLALAGCGSSPLNRAPVEDRNANGSPTTAQVVAAPIKPPPGIENAGKSGYYTVKPGDTLIRIGLESGQSQKDITRWNALDNPNKIEVGQVLRVVPPVGDSAVAVSKPVSSGSVTTTPIVSGSAAPAKAVPASAPVSAAVAVAASGTVSAQASAPVKAAPVLAALVGADDELGWIWPGKGGVIAEFDEVKNKGVDISGNAGDSVLAAADGKVVYAGAGLRGYGNLVILKHNNTYLTAYAHNQSLMVKEDQTVRKGQKIAEMGSSDADRVKLHFEVRRQGKPVDPLKYLPAK
jgi:lipoprotein NlpD